MPLPSPDCARKPSHQRSITISAYARDDGLWDIEGHLTDVWPEPIAKANGMLPAGEPMHAMWLRFTVDRTATIISAQSATDAGPYGDICGAIAPDYGQLAGVRIGRGYRDTIRKLFGRTAGCTHINELAGAMAAATMQALWGVMTLDPAQKPFSIDGCHALKSSGPQVARFFPRWYRAPGTEGA